MSDKPDFKEGRERASRTARVKRIRLFLYGAFAGFALCHLIAAIVYFSQDDRPSVSWVGVTEKRPMPHTELVISRYDGSWKAGYMDEKGAFHNMEDGSLIHGAWYYMVVPQRP